MVELAHDSRFSKEVPPLAIGRGVFQGLNGHCLAVLAGDPQGPSVHFPKLSFPYDSVHNQPGWVQLLGEVQGSLRRVLIGLEVHVGLQPQLVLSVHICDVVARPLLPLPLPPP